MSSSLKLWVLMDNNTLIDRYYLGEPAASYYLEIDDARILLDTGFSDLFIENAKRMRVDLSRLTHIVLSHGHNDHTYGLPPLAEQYDLAGVELVAHPKCLTPRWHNGEYVGPPEHWDVPSRWSYRPSTKPIWLSDHCVFLGQIPVTHDFEPRTPLGSTSPDSTEQNDLLLEDTALACKTENGLFIVTGCSHSGICNIVSYARQVCGEERIAGIIGGFHLLEASERVEKTAEFLASLNPGPVYPCHCVSLAAKFQLHEKLDVREVGSGLYLEI